MFTFAHLYKAVEVECSNADPLTYGCAAMERRDRGLDFRHGLPSAASGIAPEPERPGSRQPPTQRFAVRSGGNPPDRSPRSPPESPRLRIPCTVPERKWNGETKDGSVSPLESI